MTRKRKAKAQPHAVPPTVAGGSTIPSESQTSSNQASRQSSEVDNKSDYEGAPSAGVLERSKKPTINGGKFLQANGNITEYTINFNHTSEKESALFSSKPAVLNPAPSSDSQTSADLDSHTTETATTCSPENGNNIYERHLGLKKRGFPLWIPDPNQMLSVEYRRKGVSIGDVGIFTPSGAFSFLFNILCKRDDPVNPPDLPEDFIPLSPPLEVTDIRSLSEFKPGNFLAGATMEVVRENTSSSVLSFRTFAPDGAVLTLPEGAVAIDIENISRLRTYAAVNVEKWYRYINGPRGREAKNGEVRLVIGCDKTASWGIAAITNTSQKEDNVLEFHSVKEEQGPSDDSLLSDSVTRYQWVYSGIIEARIGGPDAAEIEQLKQGDESNIGGKYCNQCTFVRTLNLTLNNDIFKSINCAAQGSRVDNNSQTGSIPTPPPPQGTEPQTLGTESFSNQQTTYTVSPSASQKCHPSDALNKELLKQVPNSRVAITQDQDWYSVLSDNDTSMPTPEVIVKRTLAAHSIKNDKGVLYLEPVHLLWQAHMHSNVVSDAAHSSKAESFDRKLNEQLNELATEQKHSTSDTLDQSYQPQNLANAVLLATTNPMSDLTNPITGQLKKIDDSESHEEDDPDCSSSDSFDDFAFLVEVEENDFPGYFSERDGRLFHSGASPYPLPVDAPEQERCTFLHNLVYQLVGAHHIGPADEVLALQEGSRSKRQRLALDVCTGNGKWAIDMASHFRHVHFRGFDIVPIATRYPPRNVRFEISDVNATPLRWPNGTFDLINTRFVDMAVLDYARLAEEASRLLRPGGLFMSYEWSRLPAFDPSIPRDPSTHAPASTRFFDAIDKAVSTRGIRQIASHVPRFLANVGSFTEITAVEYHVPIGPWPEQPDMQGIGITCLRIHERYANSISPLLLESGWDENDVDNLVADYMQEINDVRGLVSVLYTVHARRI